MNRLLLAVTLSLLVAPAAFAQNTSTTQMQLVSSSTFTNRLQYLMAQQAAAVLAEAASDNVNADTNQRYSATCHARRYAFAQAVLSSPTAWASVSAVLISGTNLAGAVIVGTVIGTGSSTDSSANDTALAKAIADQWNTLAQCVTNP